MGLNEQKAAAYVGVVATLWSDTTGPATPQVLYRASASATSTPLTLPAGCGGKWLDIYSSAVEINYAFGVGSAPTLVFGENVAIGTGDVNAGASVPAGQVHGRVIPKGATHISLIADAGPTGKWELVLSEAPAL